MLNNSDIGKEFRITIHPKYITIAQAIDKHSSEKRIDFKSLKLEASQLEMKAFSGIIYDFWSIGRDNIWIFTGETIQKDRVE